MSANAVTSQIPPTNPRKRGVEEAIREALKAQPHPWTVEIALSRTSSARWFIKLRNAVTGFQRTVFVNGLKQQNPRTIQNRIQEALG